MAFIGERNKVLICSFLSISLQVALHACGVATDMVMEHCIQVGAAFVISPCCYGFIQNAIKFTFPRRFVTSHFTSPGVYKCCFNPCFLTFFSCNLFVSFLNVVVSWESHMSLSLRYTVYIFLSVLGFFLWFASSFFTAESMKHQCQIIFTTGSDPPPFNVSPVFSASAHFSVKPVLGIEEWKKNIVRGSVVVFIYLGTEK